MAEIRLSDDLSLPLELVTQAVGILAKRRAGKSYTAAKLVEQLFATGQQVVVVDPKGDWWGLRSSADGRSPGLPIVILGGEHGDAPLETGSGELIAQFVVEERLSVLLDLSAFRKHEVATFMTGFLETLYRLKAREQFRTAMMLVVDEADAIAPQRPQRGEERMLGAAEDIVRRGGQRGIGCTMVTQRAAVLNKNVLTQIQVLVALRTIAPQDLAAVNDWIDVHGTPEQKRELLSSLPSLPVGTAWVWSPGWPTDEGIFARVKVAPRETYDSSATPKPGEQRAAPRNLADVDLEQLRERLATTIERAQADDPKALRQQLEELKRHLTSIEQTNRVLERAAQQKSVERIEVPVLDDEQIDQFVKLTDGLRSVAMRLIDAADSIRSALLMARPTAPERPANEPGRLSRLTETTKPAERVSREPARRAPTVTDERLSAPQQRVLDALASFEALGLADMARSNVAVFSDASPGSSAFTNNLGRLRSLGLIDYPSGGRVALTNEGRMLAGPVEAIATLGQLHAAWMSKLSGPQGRILRVLINRYPKPVGREELAELAGASPTSSAYTNNLGALRSLGVLDYPRRGEVAATALLFPEGLA